MNQNIKNVRVLYDNQKRQFLKAYATVDGKAIRLENHQEIHNFLEQIKKQEQVSSLNELKGKKKITRQFLYEHKNAKNGVYVLDPTVKEWEQSQDNAFRIATSKLNKVSPFARKKVSLISNPKKAKITAVIAGLVVSIAAVGIASCASKKEVEEESTLGLHSVNAEIELEQEEEEEVSEKIAPNTWEEYLEYENSIQKSFLVDRVMEQNMKNSVKTLSIDGEDTLTVIPAEQIASGLIYYAGPQYSDEELAAIVGKYDLSTKLIPDVYNYIKTMGLNVIHAKNIDEVYIPVVGDPVVDEANEKVFKLLYEASHTANKDERRKKIEELNTIMSEYHVDGATQINIQEHPGIDLQLEVAKEVDSWYRSMNGSDLISEGNRKHFFGIAANYDVEQVGTTPEIKGRNDDACAVLDEKLESLKKYILSLDVESFEQLTKNTYDLEYMYELMNDYIKKEYNIEDIYAYDELYKELMKKTSSTDPRGEFNPHTNPAGGKPGDKYTETEKGVVVKESQLTAEEKKKAQEATGTVSAEDFDVEQKRQELTLEYTDIYNATFNHFAKESVLSASNAAYSDSWQSQYPDAWAAGKRDGENYRANKEQEGSQDNIVEDNVISGSETTDSTDVWNPSTEGEYSGSHDQNPNQTQTPPSSTTEENTTNNNENTTNTENNTTNNENTNTETNTTPSIPSGDVIEDGYDGEVTTDGTDVWDPSQYEGVEVQSYGFDDVDLERICQAAGILEEETFVEDTGYTK